MKKRWWKECVVYQIYPRSFYDSNGDGIGDIKGITSKMDYLKELGIDVIWLSPVYQSPNDDNGYDISDYQAIMKEFGTMEDFDEMLEAAHTRGIRLVMDLVVNHTSDEHAWFAESRKSSDNPTVRDEVFGMMNWWIDKGIDGFRMDVISLISKKPDLPDGAPGVNGYAEFNETANGPHVHEYLQEMREKVLNRADIMTVGECSGVTLEEAKKYAGSDEKELNMVFQFEHMDVDADERGKWSERKMDLRDLKEVLSRWQKGLEDAAWNSLSWENHDQPRSVSRFGDDGTYRETSAKMLATCLYMMQGTPYIYQGQELGMTNVPFESIEDFRDLDSVNAYRELTKQRVFSKEEMLRCLRYKSRDNARTPFQWSAEENAGFTTGTPWIMVNPNYTKINAEEQRGRETSVFYYFRKLIRLRRENEVIVYGTYDLLLPESEEIYAYTRTLGDEKLLVACNFTAKEVSFDMPEEFLGGEILIGNYEDAEIEKNVKLQPYEAVVVKR